MEESKTNHYLIVFLGVVAVSFSSLFVRLSEAHPFVIAFYRLLMTFLILLPLDWKEKTEDLRRISWRDALLAALSGVFLALHLTTWFISLRYTSVASSVVLVTTQPIWVVIASYLLFGEKIGVKSLVGGAIALFGSVVIASSDFRFGGQALFGDFLALVAAITVSGYFIIGRRLRARVSTHVYTFLAYGTSTVVLGTVASVTGKSFYPYPWREWLLFFALAFLCTVLGHTVFNWALKYVQASVIAIAILGEPVGAIIWAAVFLGENPTPRQLIFALVILSGLYIFIRYSKENSGPKGVPEEITGHCPDR